MRTGRASVRDPNAVIEQSESWVTSPAVHATMKSFLTAVEGTSGPTRAINRIAIGPTTVYHLITGHVAEFAWS